MNDRHCDTHGTFVGDKGCPFCKNMTPAKSSVKIVGKQKQGTKILDRRSKSNPQPKVEVGIERKN